MGLTFTNGFFSNYLNTLLINKFNIVGNTNEIDYFTNHYCMKLNLTLIKKIDDIDIRVEVLIERNGDIFILLYFLDCRRKFIIYDNVNSHFEFSNNVQIVHKQECFDDGVLDEDECECIQHKLSNKDLLLLFSKVDWDGILTNVINRKYSKITDDFMEYEYTNNDLVNLGYSFSECSVCYEDTIFECNNKHKICRICYFKLRRKLCPCCRIPLNNNNYNLPRTLYCGGDCLNH